MGFVSGSMKSTRFTVTSSPPAPDFEACRFTEIEPGSNIREKCGFLPFDSYEDGTPHYQIESGTFAFRFRTDTVVIDQGLLKEKMAQQIKLDLASGMPVGAKHRARLRTLIEDELLQSPAIKTRVAEGVIQDGIVYLDTAAKSQIGAILEYLKRVGVEVEYLVPWGDDIGDPHPHLDLKEPGQSIHGCTFLRQLLDDPEVMVEPEKGSVKLIGADGVKISLTGAVLPMMDDALEKDALLLTTKLLYGDKEMNFDGLAFRIKSIKIDRSSEKHWSAKLLERLEQLKAVWGSLDTHYEGMSIS